MGTEPKMFISPYYCEEFYNKCHDEGGRFCEGDSDGKARLEPKAAKGKATVDYYQGVAYNDGITDLNTVYHVSSPETADAIKATGFDPRLASSQNNWGRGIYFSTNKSDSLGTYGATAHQQGREITVLETHTNVQNPLIIETDRAGNYWHQLQSSLKPEIASWHMQDARNQTDPDEWLDMDRYAKQNLRYILDNNGNDGLVVRNPGGGGYGIGGETLVVTDPSKVWLA